MRGKVLILIKHEVETFDLSDQFKNSNQTL